ncbi:Unspecific monooxygenase [Stanieria cyanosphaera PCC 7437]|uniref:Unspecific monooxygenase n=1 Tax=Stanieria cyanosphaera (strain ATCC 29371 / PCC 7437) TaxID=111780 RepID=K9XQZ6_STAC7|nr:cytochrome P450 [Stanieria cyanosphaera]AFZ34062.1 Unspecific monooxygenase [Stanieria cyanosphaera PCC 7437]
MRQPPGPPNSRWLRKLRLFKFIFQPLEYFNENYQRYGDIYQLGRQNSPPFVVLSNPQAIKEVFTTPSEQFEIGKNNTDLKFLVGENSLIIQDGEFHQRQRKLLMPVFHGECLQSYGEQIIEITKQVTNQWQTGKLIRVRTYMQEITLRVILQIVFGLNSQQSRYEQLRQLLCAWLEIISSPLSSSLIFFEFLRQDWGASSPWGRFVRLRKQIKELLYEEIKARREQQPIGNDILSLLLATTDESGKPMTDEEIHDELITMLMAGHETTASALVWALYWVHYLPQVKEKILHELNELGEERTWHQIVQLPYLNATIAETLRIYPITTGTFTRRSKAPLQVLDYQFPAGTAFGISIYLTHWREDLYPQPELFRPERFLERQYSPYEYLPFGGGNRRCLGSALAQMEIKLVIASILSDWQLALTNHLLLKPVRRGLTIAAPNNFKIKVCDRFNN